MAVMGQSGEHHDFLREAVAQPIEHEISRAGTRHDRPRTASASKPFPVAERALEEQHLLIRDRIRCVIGFRLSHQRMSAGAICIG